MCWTCVLSSTSPAPRRCLLIIRQQCGFVHGRFPVCKSTYFIANGACLFKKLLLSPLCCERSLRRVSTGPPRASALASAQTHCTGPPPTSASAPARMLAARRMPSAASAASAVLASANATQSVQQIILHKFSSFVCRVLRAAGVFF